MIKIRSFPRLHFGLLDVSGSGHRAYGGSGVMLDALPTEVSVGYEPVGEVHAPIDQTGRHDVASALERMRAAYGLAQGFHSIHRLPPQHIGLGTKTSLIMAVLKAWEKISGIDIPDRQLQLLSGRGGASGVGIHGFFHGGFVVDAGHPSNSVTSYMPSAGHRPRDVPLVTIKSKVEERWRFTLILADGRKYYDGVEVDFFKHNTPIPASEAREAIEITHHGIVPSVISGDIELMKTALRRMHGCGFKRRELLGQTDQVRHLLSDLDELRGCAVGMSSMGPLVYVIDASGSQTIRPQILDCVARHGAKVLAYCPARNSGYEIE
ncbi:beta-ribofuranosylaminobenzene 5'-phosphate synthase family protein [Tautonia marina]|uniref:beta-ribofuranosylaminobenzene 5'-phosphate synthase family protein n=1 Tax=Tautonia marina TaxID=2653855 RepID=UPI001261131E|nr:beta-ribofuranosylaminobenzene 5'-phosphate synthase family protein [Tautonia marina]